jgi:hypothetical protein
VSYQVLGSRCRSNRNMRPRFWRVRAIQTWVVGNFDLTFEGVKARSQIESNRVRMIEGAGVHPKSSGPAFAMPARWRDSSAGGRRPVR